MDNDFTVPWNTAGYFETQMSEHNDTQYSNYITIIIHSNILKHQARI